MMLFTVKMEKDNFRHEQNLIISENKVVLIMGCGHTGVVNIMEEAESINLILHWRFSFVQSIHKENSVKRIVK